MTGDSDEILSEDHVNETSEKAMVEETPSSKQSKPSTMLEEFLNQFQELPAPEAKIHLSLDFMRGALSQSGTPRFKDFWEGRRQCLPLFKEGIPAKTRSQLWSSYIELSEEAKRLKEILDEQSAFTVEQIDLAIQALERDLENKELLMAHSSNVDLPVGTIFLLSKKQHYEHLQKELNLYNSLATRINSMRKELVKTEMRIRIKNKLLERLSKCGDLVFPHRKELIVLVSKEFAGDVDAFIKDYFSSDDFKNTPSYSLREEIKNLQSLAKVLTLNTHAFTQTRLSLSQCWDQIKNSEKERKKQVQQKRQAFKQNYDLVIEKIKAFAEKCQQEISLEECNQLSSEILDFMRGVELGRDEVRDLKAEITFAKQSILDRAQFAEKERQQKEKELENSRREKINALKEELNTLFQDAADQDSEQLQADRERLLTSFAEVQLNKTEKQSIDRLFKQLRDLIEDKKEKALLLLSEDDLIALDKLKGVLKERKERRQEIKNQLENYRKALGGSGFDFEKAISIREMIEAEKETLDKINASIDEIEEKIEEIEG